MTICRFYSNGYCRYGNSCRFEHSINTTNNYYRQNYNRFDGRQSESTQQTSAQKVGFSFNRTLESLNPNKVLSQQMPFNRNSSNFMTNETQMSSFPKNSFHLSTNTSVPTQRVSNFSFNRTLQQMSSSDGPNPRSMVDDIEMDSTAIPRMRANSGSRDSQPNSFGLFSQSNNFSVFANKPSIGTVPKTNSTLSPNTTSSLNSFDNYSKESDLTPNDVKQFESQSFTFKSIPICPPTQQLCL